MDHSEVKHLPKVDHTPAEMDAVSRLLMRAADVIERDGWCQNNVLTEDGRVCLVGAIHTANNKRFGRANDYCDPWDENSREALVRMDRVLPKVADGIGACAVWNDTPGRTKDEVVAKLRAVALGL
jgi:hypothetical protein